MTDKEKAIIMAYTGACMLTGDKFQIFHKYIEDIMGRPIMTHEIGLLENEIKEKSKADFIALCIDENPNNEFFVMDDHYKRGFANGLKTAKWRYERMRAEIQKATSRYSISRERDTMGQVEWSNRLIKESEVL